MSEMMQPAENSSLVQGKIPSAESLRNRGPLGPIRADPVKLPLKEHNAPMSEQISRPELDAKLEAIEARMDGRVARIEDAINRIAKDNERMVNENSATRAAISNLKISMIVTAIGAVLTTVIGIAAFNATVLSNMVSSFDSGKGLATSLAETAAKVDAATRRLDAAAPAPAGAAPPPATKH